MSITTVSPPEALRSSLHAAETACAAADRWRRHLQMIEAARLLRAVFPTATTVVLHVEHQHIRPHGVHLAGILEDTGAVLWSATQPEPDEVRGDHAAAGVAFSAVRARAEYTLTAALGGDDPVHLWAPADTLADTLDRRGDPAMLFRVDLPTGEDVDTTLHHPPEPTPQQRRRADLHNREARLLAAVGRAELPALRIAGALVFGYIDPTRARPTLRVSLDLDEVAAELDTRTGGAVAVEIDMQGQPVFRTPLA